MLIYTDNKRKFNKDISAGHIANRIEHAFYLHGLSHSNERECASWNNSLLEMQNVLDTPEFNDDIQVAIEYQIPQTANYDGFENDYDMKIFDDPNIMREELRVKTYINNKSRMVAGYCYEWRSKKSNDLAVYDRV